MKTFAVILASPGSRERIEDVASVVARDGSGSFGVLAGAYRRVTVLSWGLLSFRKGDGTREYLAVAGGVFHFSENLLRIATTAYFRTRNFEEIPSLLETELRRREEGIRKTRSSLHSLDLELMKRLTSLTEGGSP